MTDFIIPCATLIRLAHITNYPMYDPSGWCKSVRLESGVAVATNRAALVAERIEGGPGILHLTVDPALLAQCKLEAALESDLTVTYEPMMRWATAKTTLGWVYPGNAAVIATGENELDRWRDIIPKTPPVTSKGGMFWDADLIAAVGKTSPSGRMVFAEAIDVGQPSLIRDPLDDRWFAVFRANDQSKYMAATLPEWF